MAREHGFTFLADGEEVLAFVERGLLVPIAANGDYRLKEIAFPYARRAVATFLERLAAGYREVCGEALVVTSLTRPRSRQPRNASARSVHPTGMALDLRRPWHRTCRGWLEGTLVYLEGQGVLEATRERRPPHYHIAVFPQPYERYLARLAGGVEPITHLVASGDTLWSIAHRYRTTIEGLKAANRLGSSRIFPGQLLQVPSAR